MLVGMWTNRICRNPVLQRMFMRLGRAEKAGSGVDKIVSGWRYLGWPVPGLCGAYDACRNTPQENPTRKTDKKSLRKEQIWEFCQEPRSASEILELLGLRNKENLMEIYLTPMLKAGMLTMTEPENLRPRQAGIRNTKR